MTTVRPIKVYDADGNECVAYVEDPDYKPVTDLGPLLYRLFCFGCLVWLLVILFFMYAPG